MIREFYENCEIFVTGGSGSVGKALLEKLLRSCNVKRIYLLFRCKKNYTVEQRLEKLKKARVFEVLSKAKPDALDKLVAIPGDAVLPNLGITPEYMKVLENVSIVFHCAATVRFDEPLKVALRLNVGGTYQALKFAETLKKLKVFTHVSTFYSNPYLERIESKLYESPMDWRVCLKMLEDDSNDEALDFLTRKVITGFPNTYTFTKNLAESVVNEFCDHLPVTIYRPSIVLHALSEPVPGFPPTIMGAIGLFVLVGAGILKTVYLSPSTRFDITPQDIGIKTLLYYAFKADKLYRESKPEKVPVFMSSSRKHSPHTFLEMCMVMENGLWYESAFEKNFMIPSCHYTESRLVYLFLVFTKQILPALIADFLMILFGRKPVLMSIVRKAFTSLEVMQPFLFNTYDSDGTADYEGLLNYTANTEFDFRHELIIAGTDEGLKKICTDMIYSIRQYLLNEDPKSLPRARKILFIKIVVYNCIRAILGFYILRWFYRMIYSYISASTA